MNWVRRAVLSVMLGFLFVPVPAFAFCAERSNIIDLLTGKEEPERVEWFGFSKNGEQLVEVWEAENGEWTITSTTDMSFAPGSTVKWTCIVGTGNQQSGNLPEEREAS